MTDRKPNDDDTSRQDSNAPAPPQTAMPAPSVKSQPHATTQDQIAEMESEGQAAKPGTPKKAIDAVSTLKSEER